MKIYVLLRIICPCIFDENKKQVVGLLYKLYSRFNQLVLGTRSRSNTSDHIDRPAIESN